jgi:hypothetical protein
MLVALGKTPHRNPRIPQTISMSAQPTAQTPVASPPSSRRRYLVALLALLFLGLALTLWLTRPGNPTVIALDGVRETPGANPQSSDLYAPPRLPASVTPSGAPAVPVAPLTSSGSVATVTPAQATAASLPAAASALQGTTQVASAFTQAVGGSTPAPLEQVATTPATNAYRAAPAPPSAGPGSLTTTWAGTTPVGGTNSSLVPLGGLAETTPIGLTSPIAGQSASPTTTSASVPKAASVDVSDRTGLASLLTLVGALLLTGRRRLGRT